MMANHDHRAGKRTDRNSRVGVREPILGYYLIVTDTKETIPISMRACLPLEILRMHIRLQKESFPGQNQKERNHQNHVQPVQCIGWSKR